MSEGLFGKRDIDKYVFAVPFPTFDPDTELHAKLAEAGAQSESVAAEVDLAGAGSFQAARKEVRKALASEVRKALASDGVASEIEELVGQLLEPVSLPI
jgi:hypothetical protein